MNYKSLTLVFLSLISYHLFLITPVYAEVDLEDTYAFGEIKSLGEGVRFLVVPTFSIAAIVVIFYFLIGAFKYIISKGDKELLASARNMMIHAIIGFIILIFAFFIMQYLTESFGIPDIIGS